MIAAFLVVSYLAAAIALIDQLRRPASEWLGADRNRGSWITATVLLGIVACGLFIAVAYVVAVVPRFAENPDIDSTFRKGPS